MDLLVTLLNQMFDSGNPPDELSQEWDEENNVVIRLQWYNGKVKEYGYTVARYNAAFMLFNRRWKKRLAA